MQRRSPTADRDTTRETAKHSPTNNERSYECCCCGRSHETFLQDCPECEASAFRTNVSEDEGESEPGLVRTQLRRVAEVSAPLHPYVPR
jgi:hypothetical protein